MKNQGGNCTVLVRMLMLLAGAILLAAVTFAQRQRTTDWPAYNGDAGGQHYSALTQIHRGNVRQLRIAWTFDTGEPGGLEDNPLVISGVVYACTPSRKVIALDATNGKILWKFDSGISGNAQMWGVSYWSEEGDARIFAGIGSFFYALDARNDKVITSFGGNGRVDLHKNLGREFEHQSFLITSPAAIYRDLVIVGGKEPEEPPSPPGDIRAYDARTGALRWSFHTIPHPGDFGYDTWPKDAWIDAGAANNWAGMTVDTVRGIIYVPASSAVPDLYGGKRLGDNLLRIRCSLA
jgi:quinoprotein glucose dehydrogenase